jgi:hypothetical protein
MASPWEKYGKSSGGPWSKYEAQADPNLEHFFDKDKSVVDKLGQAAGVAGGFADDLVRMLARGATFGGADVLAAKAAEATGIGGPATLEGQQQATGEAQAALPVGVGTVAEMAGSMAPSLMLPGSATATLPRAAATGGVMAGGQQAATHYFDTGEMPDATAVATNVAIGGLFGAAGHGLGRMFQQPKMEPAIRTKMEVLNNEGIDVTSGQITKNVSMLSKEAKAPGAQEFVEKQAQAFSKAALRKAGLMAEDGRLTPDILQDGFDFVGKQMDDLALQHNIGGAPGQTILPDLLAKARNIGTKYKESVEGGSAAIIGNTVRDIAKAVKNNTMTGAQYQELTSKLEAAARTNHKLSGTAREMRAAVNEAMENYIAATDPAAANMWKMANRRYANLLVIENAAARAGRDAAEGLITPNALGMATRAIRGKRLYTRGLTDFDELSRAGQTLIRPLPVHANANGDEIARILARRAMHSAVGGTAGFAAGGGIPGALAGAAVPQILHNVSNRMALAPAASLSRTAASTGGNFGTMLGAAAASQNPFSRAINE